MKWNGTHTMPDLSVLDDLSELNEFQEVIKQDQQQLYQQQICHYEPQSILQPKIEELMPKTSMPCMESAHSPHSDSESSDEGIDVRSPSEAGSPMPVSSPSPDTTPQVVGVRSCCKNSKNKTKPIKVQTRSSLLES